MESYTVARVGRSASRVMFAAERGPVEIVRKGKRIGVVISPDTWKTIRGSMVPAILAEIRARGAAAYKAFRTDRKGPYYEGQSDAMDELEVWIKDKMNPEAIP